MNSVSIGLHRGVQRGDLLHHRFVDGEAARRVDDQHVVIVLARPVERRLGNRHRLLVRARREEVDADLRREQPQLLDRRGPVHVGGHEQHLLLLFWPEEARELGRRRGLAGALQSGEQDHRGRLRRERQRRRGAAHQRGEFAVHDADQRLARRQRAGDLGADRLFPDDVDEVPDHRQRDVGFEQREPHFAQRVLDVVVGEPRLSAQLLDDAGKSLGEIVEHRKSGGVRSAS